MLCYKYAILLSRVRHSGHNILQCSTTMVHNTVSDIYHLFNTVNTYSQTYRQTHRSLLPSHSFWTLKICTTKY